MTEPVSPPDIAITGVTVSTSVVATGGTFDVNVTVFAPDEDFEDGVAFRLFCVVCTCGGDPPAHITPASPLKGHVQDGFWTTPTSTTTFTVTAGATPAIYNVTAFLLEGVSGLPEQDDLPVSTGSAGPVFVI